MKLSAKKTTIQYTHLGIFQNQGPPKQLIMLIVSCTVSGETVGTVGLQGTWGVWVMLSSPPSHAGKLVLEELPRQTTPIFSTFKLEMAIQTNPWTKSHQKSKHLVSPVHIMSFPTIQVFPNVRLLVPIQLLGAVPAHVAATPIDDGKHRR